VGRVFMVAGLMARKSDSVGRRLVRDATRFLFPLDAPRSPDHVSSHRLGDKRTRQYADSGREREITGAALRRARQRDENWRSR
jgi:hypothetical protein